MPKYRITAEYEDGRAIYDSLVDAASPKEALEKTATEVKVASVVDVSNDVKAEAVTSRKSVDSVTLDGVPSLDTDKKMN